MSVFLKSPPAALNPNMAWVSEALRWRLKLVLIKKLDVRIKRPGAGSLVYPDHIFLSRQFKYLELKTSRWAQDVRIKRPGAK